MTQHENKLRRVVSRLEEHPGDQIFVIGHKKYEIFGDNEAEV